MSGVQDDKKPDDVKPQDEPGVNITVSVDKSKAEEELRKELEAEKTAKIEANQKLETLNKEIESMKSAGQEKEKEYEDKLAEMEVFRDKVAEFAMNEFNRRKETYNEKLTATGMEAEKIEEILGGIQKPEDLDNAEIYLTLISEQLGKAQEDLKKIEEEKKAVEEAAQQAANQQPDPDEEQKKLDAMAAEANARSQGGGIVQLDKPVNTTGVYADHREAIDDLYARHAKGDQKATQELIGLWQLGVKKLKEQRIDFSVTQCPRCGGGIEEGDDCPYCGFKEEEYFYKGNLWG
jgi:hypothetical protein